MAPLAPKLDEYWTFQKLVDEAKLRIASSCPQWTDHNVSDPGVTLIELFAWMTEIYLYRLNQMPDRNFLTFLDLIGVRLKPAQPAKGDVTFSVVTPTPERRVVIPRWTEVATERTETAESIVFTTDLDAEARPSTIKWFLTTHAGGYQDHPGSLAGDQEVDIWSTPPRAAEEFCIGFEEDLSTHTIVLNFRCKTNRGSGAVPSAPPWKWWAWRGSPDDWELLAVKDETGGLNRNGRITLTLPGSCQSNVHLRPGAHTWLKCSPIEDTPKPYTVSPRLTHIDAFTSAITIPVTQAQRVGPEMLGTSSGAPGQKFRLQYRDVLNPEGPEEVLEVAGEEGTWQRVDDFGDSQETDRHYILDPIDGDVEFGPLVRQPDGSEKQFGAVPPAGRTLHMARYRTTAGMLGNVAAEKVNVLKSTVVGVKNVINHQAITGGLESQSLEDAKVRAPAYLRSRWRAVTADDYEQLVQEGVQTVGRVRCLQPTWYDPTNPGARRPDEPRPGTVLLLIIPRLPSIAARGMDDHIKLHEELAERQTQLAAERELLRQLELGDLEKQVRDYLDPRRLLTVQLDIKPPKYVWVTVITQIKVKAKAKSDQVLQDVKVELYRRLHPLAGGADGTGWPFGQPLTIDKVYSWIQAVSGVEYVTDLQLYPVHFRDPTGKDRFEQVENLQRPIAVPPEGTIVSYFHRVHAAD